MMNYMQLWAFGKISQRLYFIDTERYDLKIRHFLYDWEIFQLIPPKIKILNVVEVIWFGLVEH